MYIEDLIKKIVASGMFSFNDSNLSKFATTKDYDILMNMSDQLDLGNALTEKQSVLALRILNSNHLQLALSIPEMNTALANPKWKFPFRTLSLVKQVSIESHAPKGPYSGAQAILVRFPYTNDLVETFRKRNQEVHDLHKGHWDHENKYWVFNLTEKNIAYLGDMLIPLEFQTDLYFQNYYNEICKIREEIEQHIPMLVTQNDGFEIQNAHRLVQQPCTDNLIEALFNARHQGISMWDDQIQENLDQYSNSVTKLMLTSNKKDRVWLSDSKVDISEFEDLIKYGGTILIIVPGGSELELTKKWVNLATQSGIDIKHISVMFRLPNEQASFNQYVREEGLNNPVTLDTKVVFVSTKITKPVIKSGIKFNTAINLGYYNYMHFTMNVIVDNLSNLVYYSMQAPTEYRKWQPQEL